MRARQRLWGGAAVAALAAAALWASWPAAEGSPAGPAAGNPPPAAGPSALAGTASCSARGCHGALAPVAGQDIRRDEYAIWLTEDRHAEAYRVLESERSAEIVHRLYGEGHRATEEVRCLACHTNPLAAVTNASPLLKEERTAGVGCESCHGAAEKWVGPHTTKEFRDLAPEDKQKGYGMVAVGKPAVLAEVCAGCHVGAPADPARGLPLRDMNHDLIAAGHPRLAFEFGAFLANLPPHWNEAAKKKSRAEGFEARCWAVGQVVSAEAALKLLADRAAAANSAGRPWPEFSEYGCFACHHDLSEPSWRQQRGYAGRVPGSLPWGTWYFALPGPPADRETITSLRKLMERPLPPAKDVAEQAGKLAGQLALQRGADTNPAEVRRRLRSLADGKDGPMDWDAAEQLYLAAMALNPDEKNELGQSLKDLAAKRAFPQGSDSPKGFRPDQFLPELRKALEKLPE
jgi:hypothetical protein